MICSEELLQILACPACLGALKMLGPAEMPENLRAKASEGLLCPACSVIYPIQDNIPVLLKDEALPV